MSVYYPASGAGGSAFGPLGSGSLSVPATGDLETAVNPGSSTLTAVDNGLEFLIAANGGSTNLRIYPWALDGSTKSVLGTTHFSALLAANYGSIGIMMRDSSSGKGVAMYQTGTRILFDRVTSPTSIANVGFVDDCNTDAMMCMVLSGGNITMGFAPGGNPDHMYVMWTEATSTHIGTDPDQVCLMGRMVHASNDGYGYVYHWSKS